MPQEFVKVLSREDGKVKFACLLPDKKESAGCQHEEPIEEFDAEFSATDDPEIFSFEVSEEVVKEYDAMVEKYQPRVNFLGHEKLLQLFFVALTSENPPEDPTVKEIQEEYRKEYPEDTDDDWNTTVKVGLKAIGLL